LESFLLPPFHRIEVKHIEPAIDQILEEIKAATETVLEDGEYSWEHTLRPLEDMDDRLSRVWSPVSHLHNVADNEELRGAYNACLPKLSAYGTEKYQNVALHRAFKTVATAPEFAKLGDAERRIIDNALRDFRLSGVELKPAERDRFRHIKLELSRLQTRYEENLLDATHAWNKHVTREEDLAGMPPSALALARQTAQRDNKDGWLLSLEMPSYRPVMAYCENRALREEMYHAYVTRASNEGPCTGKWDNSAVMDEILDLRFELARLLGFSNYAEYSLATKMARQPRQVVNFLEDLARRCKPVAEREMEELRKFARDSYGVDDLQAWDIAFYAERLREDRYNISQEELRPYFPAPAVLKGLFAVVERLYGIRIEARDDVDTWHPDVRFFVIQDAEGTTRGMFYVDLYARPRKRGGAWMDECASRRRRPDGSLQIPVAYLNCNFTPPVGEVPALLTHDEVLTLFHEFGHGLHHMLTLIDRPSVAGINGVAWDAVELPSQFMENWCWEREALDLVGHHHDTGATIEPRLFERMHAAKNFHAGMQMVRQLEFALFDFRLHMDYDPEHGVTVQTVLDAVREQVAVVKPPAYNRFQNGFSHIFAGGYAAGYYSYKWAEVLSADAFSKFEERGIFDSRTGHEFLQAILEPGGSRDPMELFVQFRGREPSVDALLRHSGIAA
jgi:oligopeptidase A